MFLYMPLYKHSLHSSVIVMELKCVEYRSRCWSLTINNHTEDDVAQLHTVFNLCDDFACQEEVGKSGTPHVQGYIYFKNGKTDKVVRGLIPRGHWERARKRMALKMYCSKEKTRTGRQWRKNIMNDGLRVIHPGKPSIDEFMARAMLWYKNHYDV